jgi:uncharacterized protein YabN with tetrapyrrole methylase and pyrophosphatase domain
MSRRNSSRLLRTQITKRLLAAAAGGEDVVYAVPGDPCIAEMTVRLLRESVPGTGVTVRAFASVALLSHRTDPCVIRSCACCPR